MGPKCTTLQLGGNVDITGNGNNAIIFNGVSYNISSIVNSGLNFIMKKFRSELIIIQFSSIFFLTILWCAIILYLSLKRTVNRDVESVLNESDVQLEINHSRLKVYLIELDTALQEVGKLLENNYPLQYFVQPLECIENVYQLVRSSPNLLSVMITKLIDKNYTGLCLAVLTLKNTNPCQNSETWQSMTSALTGLCCFMRESSKICFAAVDAQIIPKFVLVLSQRSYLEDLNTNTPVLFLFLMTSRMFHYLAQVEILRYELERHNCCDILLNVIAHTNNRMLRAINILTVTRIMNKSMHKISFTFEDILILFRLYYESVKSDSQEVYGLKQQHIINGFYAIGQLDYLGYDFKKH